ncbi:AAA family ATPase [Streptomyces agglomeratus]
MVSGPEHPVTVPLLERETELAAAAQAVDALCADAPAGGVLVCSGEAGLGKTALLSEIRRLAAGRCAV